ncbi:MAG: ATP-dependent helicase/nuclease subunit A [Candidatus Midichloriaceae bacterium]|jgi:ATP-dependent helicase/nuclease subunit A
MMQEQNTNTANETQNIASNPKFNVYLSASAGTGKTKTLIDRILRLLLNGTPIDSILCLTFTNAAASEMVERLKIKVEQWAKEKDDILIQELKILLTDDFDISKKIIAKQLYFQLLNNIDKFRIQTLHSFCTEVLSRANFFDIATLKDLNIIDDYNKNKFIESAYNEFITNDNDETTKKLISKFDSNTLLNFLQIITSQKQNLYKFFNSSEDLISLIKKQYTFYESDIESCSEKILKDFCKNKSDFEIYLRNLENHGENVITTLNDWYSLDFKDKKHNLKKYLNCFFTKNNTLRKKVPFSSAFIKDHTEIKALYIDEQQKVYEFIESYAPYDQAEFMKAIIIFLNNTIAKYEKLKAQYSFVEYDDLIIKTLELFSSSNDIENLMYSLDISLSHILIDEAQDLSELQWILIQKIMDTFLNTEKSIFIVGDFKQSIYSFQGAFPEHFIAINDIYKNKCGRENLTWKNLTLNHSFRSKKEILSAVDTVFSNINPSLYNIKHIPTKEAGGIIKIIEHDKLTVLETKNWILPKKNQLDIDKHYYQSQEIAKFIFTILQKDNVNANDIMVIFRKRGNKLNYLADALNKMNISVTQNYKLNFTNNLLVLDLLSLIKYFLLPEDKLNTASLLKSTYFKLTEQELLNLCINDDKNICDSLEKDYPKISSKLNLLREEYYSTSLYEFYNNVLYKHGYIKCFIKEFGIKSYEILDIFFNKITEFEKKYHSGSHHFLDWVEKNSSVTIDEKKENGVKIVTAHSAKGLQSPIVIIADASDSENMPIDDFYWYNNNLIVNSPLNYPFESLKQAKNELNLKRKEESFRLLYVSLTRAENELYIFGEDARKKNNWYETLKNILPEYFTKYDNLIIVDGKITIEKQKQNNIEIPEFLIKKHHHISKKSSDTASNQKDEQQHLSITEGVFIHSILENISNISYTNIPRYIENLYLTDEFSVLTNLDINEIIAITKSIIKKYPKIFNTDVYSELALNSIINNKSFSLRIDKLIINKTSIDIIDIKTDKNESIDKSNIPTQYVKQLKIYEKSMKNLYPSHDIHCQILSFYQQKLFDIKTN